MNPRGRGAGSDGAQRRFKGTDDAAPVQGPAAEHGKLVQLLRRKGEPCFQLAIEPCFQLEVDRNVKKGAGRRDLKSMLT